MVIRSNLVDSVKDVELDIGVVTDSSLLSVVIIVALVVLYSSKIKDLNYGLRNPIVYENKQTTKIPKMSA